MNTWRAIVLVALAILLTACTESPQEAVGERAIDALEGDEPVMPRFQEASVRFEEAMAAFNKSPTRGRDALDLAEQRLEELRAAFDAWSPLVDEVIRRRVRGTPIAELQAWRDAAEDWIEAQERIIFAVVDCGGDAACTERAQERHTPGVVTATLEGQEAKREFIAAVKG